MFPGFRIKKLDSSGVETHYVFDTEGKVLEEMDIQSGSTISSVFLKNRHLARVEDSETLYYGTDHLSSTVLMTDETSNEVWSGDVTPFGDVTKIDSDLDIAMKYTGKDFDEDTDLYYYNARWYDAETGRFISEDPVRDGHTWYGYVSNNPLKYIDPTGLEGVLFLYSNDITGPGTDWEYTFQEGAYAEALKNRSVGSDTPVQFVGVSNRGDFESAIESFYAENGKIDELNVYSHMYEEGLNLNNQSTKPDRLVKSSDLENIDAEISRIKLSGCNAGADTISGENIAQAFANNFDTEVTASTSGTWFVGDTNSSGPFERPGLTLEPNGGEWKNFEPISNNE